jgi:hypothetical protein
VPQANLHPTIVHSLVAMASAKDAMATRKIGGFDIYRVSELGSRFAGDDDEGWNVAKIASDRR